jgi:predicted unusual protein kinase regulating ubiquinone biosynthesis (AarF/ABC1/UbiB family)
LQVILAAVFDLLFSQCDRHGQNLYLKPDGAIVLIDNDQVGAQLVELFAAAGRMNE